MATALHAFTYEDLEKMPDDGRRYELINGEIVVSPSSSQIHQKLVWRLAFLLRMFVQAGRLGRVILGPFDVRFLGAAVQPDILYVSSARLDILRGNHAVGAPDLVVEVLSPSTRDRDEGDKLTLYAAGGVREYWLADPVGQTFRALALDADRFRPIAPVGPVVPSALLPGLEVNIPDLFAGLP